MMVDEIVLSRLDEELLQALDSGDWMSRSEITEEMHKTRWYGSWEISLARLEKLGKVESRQAMSKAKSGQTLWQYRIKSEN